MGPTGTCRVNRLLGTAEVCMTACLLGGLGKDARLSVLNHRNMLISSYNIFLQVSVRLRNCSESVSSIAVLGF